MVRRGVRPGCIDHEHWWGEPDRCGRVLERYEHERDDRKPGRCDRECCVRERGRGTDQ